MLKSGDMCDIVFVPDFIKKGNAVQVAGVVTIHIPAFDNFLSSSPLASRKTFYLGAHISNFEEFFYPVLIGEPPEVKIAVDRILSGVKKSLASVPLNIEDLRDDLLSNKVGKHNLSVFWSADGKTQALIDWLQSR